jgi:hypothetical protein
VEGTNHQRITKATKRKRRRGRIDAAANAEVAERIAGHKEVVVDMGLWRAV